jgi:uncharacterized protein YecT (DUF1311 family)
MRLLHVSIAIATSAVLAACDAGTRTGSAAARARDSSLARDLELAAEGGRTSRGGRDSGIVSQASDTLGASRPAEPDIADGSPPPENASDTSSRSEPSTEGYIGPSCGSPARDDQQRCLLDYLAKSDALLDRYYQALILHLKSEAGTTSRAGEPPSVQRLRTAQRAWLVYRDDECRKRTRPREGPLWAPVRAQCLAAYSAVRAQEFKDALARRKALARRDEPTKSAPRSGGTPARAAQARQR